MKIKFLTLAFCTLMCSFAYALEDTFKPYATQEEVPTTLEGLWKDFDPRKEPLDVEILDEWEKDGVVVKVLRYRAFVFNGEKSMVAAVYGYPKGGKNLPALVQTHGGGQFAEVKHIYENAKRGYATIAIAWHGRIRADKYEVDDAAKKIFIAGDTSNPKYKVTTYWGGFNGYGAKSMTDGVYEGSMDKFPSPRNCQFFLGTVAGRRAITFLEQQKEVNPDKIGNYGHSMGGRLTTLIGGSDSRSKASSPSCGGIVESTDMSFVSANRTLPAALQNGLYLANMKANILFASPSNDFYGMFDYLSESADVLKSDFRIASSLHSNHAHEKESIVCTHLWMDSQLKGNVTLPKTPLTKLSFKDGIVTMEADVDKSATVNSVDFFYTQQGAMPDNKDNMKHRTSRYWHRVPAKLVKGKYVAQLPIHLVDESLWAFAHVNYAMEFDKDVNKLYKSVYDVNSFYLSSVLIKISKEEMVKNAVKQTAKKTNIIENFQGEWWKNFDKATAKTARLETHKTYDPMYSAPKGAKLEITLSSTQACGLNILIEHNTSKRDAASTKVKVVAGDNQRFVINASDLKFKNKPMANFDTCYTLILQALTRGDNPITFKQIRWIE